MADARPLRGRPVPRPAAALAHLARRRRRPRPSTGALALLLRALAGHRIVDQLLIPGEADRDAADAAWGIATSTTVQHLAGAAIGLGAVVVLPVGACSPCCGR